MPPVRHVFADTAYWIALVDKRDSYRERALRVTAEITGTITTTSEVLTETANALSREPWRQEVVRLIDALAVRNDVVILEPDAGLWRRGWSLYKERPDKEWSLTDCISITVMREKGIPEALTTDAHFEQAGFRAIMRGTD